MKLLKSKKGFTLIELLVVIGILAVLAAIAIPSVAGLIDRANASADKTNANEMTNAIERFASEYELYCQDVASGAIKDTSNPADGQPDNLDAAQGRVYNVTKAFTRDDIEELEVSEETPVDDEAIAIYRDTKYPANAKTMQAIVENYTKTSSATFTPKQSDMHYWYSPDCGVVVIAKKNASTADLNKLVVSGMDAKGNELDGSVVWIDMTDDASLGAGDAYNANIIPTGGVYTSNGVQYTAGETFPTPQPGDRYTYGDYSYFYCSIIGGEGYEVPSGFEVAARDRTKTHYDNILASVNGIPVTSVGEAWYGCSNLVDASNIVLPNTVAYMDAAFDGCTSMKYAPVVPTSAKYMTGTFGNCVSLIALPATPSNLISPSNIRGIFYGCTQFGY